MSDRNKIHLFPDYTVQVKVEDIVFESQLIYISLTDFAMKILSPEEFKGSQILSPHVPYFANPVVNGYLTPDNELSEKFHAYVQGLHEAFYKMHMLFRSELSTVQEYWSAGCDEDDIRGYFKYKYDVMFNIDDLPYFMKFYKVTI